MADPNQSVSNGTCFWAPNIESDPRFIPCGNAAFGDVHCCQAGDYCLADGACYNDRWGTTYLAGCTDVFYEDPSCPDKQSYNGMTMMTMAGRGGIAGLTTNNGDLQISHGLA
jgi:hypothetical protein